MLEFGHGVSAGAKHVTRVVKIVCVTIWKQSTCFEIVLCHAFRVSGCLWKSRPCDLAATMVLFVKKAARFSIGWNIPPLRCFVWVTSVTTADRVAWRKPAAALTGGYVHDPLDFPREFCYLRHAWTEESNPSAVPGTEMEVGGHLPAFLPFLHFSYPKTFISVVKAENPGVWGQSPQLFNPTSTHLPTRNSEEPFFYMKIPNIPGGTGRSR